MTKEEQDKAIQENEDRIDELAAELEEARAKVLAPKTGPNLLPSDWNAWDVYLPHQASGTPAAAQPDPNPNPYMWGAGVVPQTEEKPAKAAPKYSEYLKEKSDEYEDKYILD